MKMGIRVGLASLFLAALTAWAAEKSAEERSKESETRLLRDLTFLASDECEGRGPTTQGINKAADHIAAEFKKTGLKPAGQAGSYFQYFTIPGSRLTAPATLTFSGPKSETLEPKSAAEFHALGLSHSGAVKDAGVVFAGFGISSKDFDEWKDLEAAGKVVIVLRDAPRFITGNQRRQHAALVEKMTQAAKRDALAILFVNDAQTAKDGDDLLDFNYLATARNANAKIPAYHIKRALADKMLAAADLKDLAKLEAAIHEDQKPQSTPIKGWTASLEARVKRDGIELKNVIGVLEGKGPRANETVVLGAHYDHLGYGGQSSLANLKKMAIHYGADDNGSGTTSILELARRFAAIPERQGRRLVFMAFSGEELGLLGSAHYCKNPIFPLADTAAMINLDMVGRLVKEEKLQIWGTGTAKTFDALIEDLNKKYSFKLRKVTSGFGPSDHSSFYEKKVPVFFFFTGDHGEYHRPTDKVEKINFPGMKKVVDMVEELAGTLATGERPEYVAVKAASTPRPGGGPKLGIRPAYGEESAGVLIEGVSSGEAAEKAGLKGGDRIIEMGGKKIMNLEGYMLFMKEQKAGATIDVTVVREKKDLKLKVKLD